MMMIIAITIMMTTLIINNDNNNNHTNNHDIHTGFLDCQVSHGFRTWPQPGHRNLANQRQVLNEAGNEVQ